MTSTGSRSSFDSVIFSGPGGKTFDSFLDLCNYSMESYFPDWKNYSNPKTYVTPPIFYFQHPEIGDGEIPMTDGFNRLKLDRGSDSSENTVYKAISRMQQEIKYAPFLAIHQFDLNKISSQLMEIFSSTDWKSLDDVLKDCNREYDFVLIGPKFGVIFIEAKHSHFTQSKHFKAGNKFLPDDLEKGLKQLKTADSLVKLLLELVKGGNGIESIRKILFLPNLEKERFNNWLNSLNAEAGQKIREKTNQAILWFKEDSINSDQHAREPILYSKMLEIFENSHSFEIGEKIYEIYAPLMIGLSSVVTLFSAGKDQHAQQPKKRKIVDTVSLGDFKLSESKAIQEQMDRIISQDPANLLSKSATVLSTETISHNSKIIILTPDQQKALRGPKHLYILGPAGVGKTLILMEKAVRLLKTGEKVLILTAKGFIPKYEELCQTYSNDLFVVLNWEYLVSVIFNGMFKNDDDLKNYYAWWKGGKFDSDVVKPLQEGEDDSEYWEKLVELSKEKINAGETALKKDVLMATENSSEKTFLAQLVSWVSDSFDHILIDDAVDFTNYYDFATIVASFSTFLFMEILGEKKFRNSVIWIALDLNAVELNLIGMERFESITDDNKAFFNEIRNHFQLAHNSENNFQIAELEKIMRCSEEVFQEAFRRVCEILPGHDFSLGHKIQGAGYTKLEERHKNKVDAKNAFIRLILEQINQLVQRGTEYKDIAVVVFTASADDYLDDIFQTPPIMWSFSLEQKSLEQKSNSCLAYGWGAVSSLEWPVVIFAFFGNVGDDEVMAFELEYGRYRAETRAVVKLIEIIVTCDLDNNNA